MPALTRTLIKSSLVFFVLALVAGIVTVSPALAQLSPYFSALSPVYFHLFLVGWISQLIFGVVFWMFPKFSKEKPRGSETLGWVMFWLLNIGLVLRAVGEPWRAVSSSVFSGWILVVSAILQWLAGMAFVANTWGRVKEK